MIVKAQAIGKALNCKQFNQNKGQTASLVVEFQALKKIGV
jgi:hypothetical protein